MSLSADQLIDVLNFMHKLSQDAAASLSTPNCTLFLPPLQLRLATDNERDRYGASVVGEFETTGEHTHLNHHDMAGVLAKLATDLSEKNKLVLSTNVVNGTRDKVVFPTDDEPGPVCGRRKCNCCGGKYIMSERYCKFMVYLSGNAAECEHTAKKARQE